MFVLVTLVAPAAAWWFLVRIEAAEFHWAVLGFGITVVLLAYGIYGIGGWRAEGREGFVKDVFDTYSVWMGGWVSVAVVVGFGCLIGELGADAFKWANNSSQA